MEVNLAECLPNQFEKLFNDYYKGLCFFAYRIVNNWQVAEDICQDFFIKCWQNKKTIDVVANFKSYSITSVKNACYNYIKHVKLADARDLEYTLMHKENAGNNLDNEQTFDDERILKLISVIDKLPPQRKKIFILFHFQNLKSSEVAELENLSVETVKTQIKLAYRFLRETLLFIFF